ncbi:hypothetical protein [Bergeriella denitrificans]|uniref:Phage associated protein n=1 Tax=Bergeriella denitrificans TaxID=494 RepID=A0A378ULM1_BERDE|nr:hypothetical protein [Bergeriella denitrificans]STZ77372.1 phage associated protein [Bergeriella denitrificans]
MANSNTEHSRKLRQTTAAAFAKAKLASGEYKQFAVKGKAEDIDAVLAAIEKAGGSKIQALKKICTEWLASR